MNNELKNSIQVTLKQAFKNWQEEKQQFIKHAKELDLKENEERLWRTGDCDVYLVDYLIKIILEQGLSPESMELVFKRMCYYFSEWIPKQAPVLCFVNFDFNNYINALEWTIVNVYDLNFFDMSDINFKIPYNQCHYCGKPNSFLHKTGIKNFNKKRKYCHTCTCEKIQDANGSNPKEHEECCFGKYAIEKKKLYEKIRRIKTEEDIKDKVELFIDYLETRFKENLKIKWSIKTEQQKAIYEYDWLDEESWNDENYEEIEPEDDPTIIKIFNWS